MMITNYGLEMMGFVPIPESMTIEARFMSVNIYEARGINLVKSKNPLKPTIITSEATKIENLTFIFGTSLNKCCKALIGDNFTDDEAKWRADTKSNPPYLVVITKLPDIAVCGKGYWKNEDEAVITHDCFSSTKQLLEKEEAKKTSVLITSLTVSLSSSEQVVKFVPICRDVLAETNLGKFLRDYQIVFNADIRTSRGLTIRQLSKKTTAALEKYNEFHPKVGYFFDLAIREKDKLKAFIYFFLVIEIFTHHTFQHLDHEVIVAKLHLIPERVKGSATDFLLERQKESKNLLQRFVFCAMAKWDEINDNDIATFKLVKKTRDRIYHGEEVSEKALPIQQTQSLALKLLHSLFHAGESNKPKVKKARLTLRGQPLKVE